MNHILAHSPYQILSISSFYKKLRIKFTVKSAELLGFWISPKKDAASLAEEMSRQDAYYWVYKSKNPIIHPESGVKEYFSQKFIKPKNFTPYQQMKFSAVGDILWSDNLEYSKDILFENIKDDLFKNSLSFANFESPVTTQSLKKEIIGDAGPPIECCSEDQFNVIKGHKNSAFTLFNLANNHIADMGQEGINTTLNVLERSNIESLGACSISDRTELAKIIHYEGFKIGFITATFGLNGRKKEEYCNISVIKFLSKKEAPDLTVLSLQIEYCKQNACDFIFASLHWGHEFEFFPRKEQIELAHTIIELGADAILGHHSHVVQPVEYYQTKRDPNRIAIIAYSLGSLTWRFTAPHLVLSSILNIELNKGTCEGRAVCYAQNVTVTPVFRQYQFWQNKLVTKIEKLEDFRDRRLSRKTRKYIEKVHAYWRLVSWPSPITNTNSAKNTKIAWF